MNYRWKFGAGKWKWPRQLHKVHDASGDRLCGLVNGSVVGGVLPAAQFCNTLTHSVLSLWRVHGVQAAPVPLRTLRTHVLTHARTHSRTHARTHSLTHSRTHVLTHALT